MPDLEVMTGTTALSFSSFNSILSCGERYRLERVLGVPKRKAWYLLGGSAVHKATELIDQGIIIEPQDAWDRAWAEQLATLVPGEESELLVGGRKTKDWPNKENRDWWERFGPEQVKHYSLFSAHRRAQGWHLMDVETAFHVNLGDVEVRGFIDRVWVDPNGEVEISDLKTGTRAPSSTVQLGVYRIGLRQSLNIDSVWGSYCMTRDIKSPDYEPPRHSLALYSEEMLNRWFSRAKAIVENELFIPNVGFLCGTCSVAQFCEAQGGTPPISTRK